MLHKFNTLPLQEGILVYLAHSTINKRNYHSDRNLNSPAKTGNRIDVVSNSLIGTQPVAGNDFTSDDLDGNFRAKIFSPKLKRFGENSIAKNWRKKEHSPTNLAR